MALSSRFGSISAVGGESSEDEKEEEDVEMLAKLLGNGFKYSNPSSLNFNLGRHESSPTDCNNNDSADDLEMDSAWKADFQAALKQTAVNSTTGVRPQATNDSSALSRASISSPKFDSREDKSDKTNSKNQASSGKEQTSYFGNSTAQTVSSKDTIKPRKEVEGTNVSCMKTVPSEQLHNVTNKSHNTHTPQKSKPEQKDGICKDRDQVIGEHKAKIKALNKALNETKTCTKDKSTPDGKKNLITATSTKDKCTPSKDLNKKNIDIATYNNNDCEEPSKKASKSMDNLKKNVETKVIPESNEKANVVVDKGKSKSKPKEQKKQRVFEIKPASSFPLDELLPATGTLKTATTRNDKQSKPTPEKQNTNPVQTSETTLDDYWPHTPEQVDYTNKTGSHFHGTVYTDEEDYNDFDSKYQSPTPALNILSPVVQMTHSVSPVCVPVPQSSVAYQPFTDDVYENHATVQNSNASGSGMSEDSSKKLNELLVAMEYGNQVAIQKIQAALNDQISKNRQSVVESKLATQPTVGFYNERSNLDASDDEDSPKDSEDLFHLFVKQVSALVKTDEDRNKARSLLEVLKKEGGDKLSGTIVTPPSAETATIDEKLDRELDTDSTPADDSGQELFEGRTLLKGGVEARHIPKTSIANRSWKHNLVDPRTVQYQTKPTVHLMLPAFHKVFCEEIREKIKETCERKAVPTVIPYNVKDPRCRKLLAGNQDLIGKSTAHNINCDTSAVLVPPASYNNVTLTACAVIENLKRIERQLQSGTGYVTPIGSSPFKVGATAPLTPEMGQNINQIEKPVCTVEPVYQNSIPVIISHNPAVTYTGNLRNIDTVGDNVYEAGSEKSTFPLAERQAAGDLVFPMQSNVLNKSNIIEVKTIDEELTGPCKSGIVTGNGTDKTVSMGKKDEKVASKNFSEKDSKEDKRIAEVNVNAKANLISSPDFSDGEIRDSEDESDTKKEQNKENKTGRNNAKRSTDRSRSPRRSKHQARSRNDRRGQNSVSLSRNKRERKNSPALPNNNRKRAYSPIVSNNNRKREYSPITSKLPNSGRKVECLPITIELPNSNRNGIYSPIMSPELPLPVSSKGYSPITPELTSNSRQRGYSPALPNNKSVRKYSPTSPSNNSQRERSKPATSNTNGRRDRSESRSSSAHRSHRPVSPSRRSTTVTGHDDATALVIEQASLRRELEICRDRDVIIYKKDRHTNKKGNRSISPVEFNRDKQRHNRDHTPSKCLTPSKDYPISHSKDGSISTGSRGHGHGRDDSKGRSQDGSKGRSRDGSKGRSRDDSKGRSRDDSKGRSLDGSKGRARDDSKGRSRDDSIGRSRDDSKGRSRDGSKGRSRDAGNGHRVASVGQHIDGSGDRCRDSPLIPDHRDLSTGIRQHRSPSIHTVSTDSSPGIGPTIGTNIGHCRDAPIVIELIDSPDYTSKRLTCPPNSRDVHSRLGHKKSPIEHTRGIHSRLGQPREPPIGNGKDVANGQSRDAAISRTGDVHSLLGPSGQTREPAYQALSRKRHYNRGDEPSHHREEKLPRMANQGYQPHSYDFETNGNKGGIFGHLEGYSHDGSQMPYDGKHKGNSATFPITIDNQARGDLIGIDHKIQPVLDMDLSDDEMKNEYKEKFRKTETKSEVKESIVRVRPSSYEDENVDGYKPSVESSKGNTYKQNMSKTKKDLLQVEDDRKFLEDCRKKISGRSSFLLSTEGARKTSSIEAVQTLSKTSTGNVPANTTTKSQTANTTTSRPLKTASDGILLSKPANSLPSKSKSNDFIASLKTAVVNLPLQTTSNYNKRSTSGIDNKSSMSTNHLAKKSNSKPAVLSYGDMLHLAELEEGEMVSSEISS